VGKTRALGVRATDDLTRTSGTSCGHSTVKDDAQAIRRVGTTSRSMHSLDRSRHGRRASSWDRPDPVAAGMRQPFRRAASQTVSVESVDGHRVFRLRGWAVESNALLLVGALEPMALEEGDLILDLRHVDSMDTVGLWVFTHFAKCLRGRGRLVLVSPPERIRRRLLPLTEHPALGNVMIVRGFGGLTPS